MRPCGCGESENRERKRRDKLWRSWGNVRSGEESFRVKIFEQVSCFFVGRRHGWSEEPIFMGTGYCFDTCQVGWRRWHSLNWVH